MAIPFEKLEGAIIYVGEASHDENCRRKVVGTYLHPDRKDGSIAVECTELPFTILKGGPDEKEDNDDMQWGFIKDGVHKHTYEGFDLDKLVKDNVVAEAIKGIIPQGKPCTRRLRRLSAASRGVLNPSFPHSLGHVRASTAATSLRSSIKKDIRLPRDELVKRFRTLAKLMSVGNKELKIASSVISGVAGITALLGGLSETLKPVVSDGFRAWFVLQHYFGCIPFRTRVEKEIVMEKHSL